jgi:hypothetical protein
MSVYVANADARASGCMVMVGDLLGVPSDEEV